MSPVCKYMFLKELSYLFFDPLNSSYFSAKGQVDPLKICPFYSCQYSKSNNSSQRKLQRLAIEKGLKDARRKSSIRSSFNLLVTCLQKPNGSKHRSMYYHTLNQVVAPTEVPRAWFRAFLLQMYFFHPHQVE